MEGHLSFGRRGLSARLGSRAHEELLPIEPTIDQAFAWSRTLVEEVDLDEMNNPATMIGLVGKATLPQGQTLDQLCPRRRLRP